MGRIAAGQPKRDRVEEVLDYFPRLGERMSQQAGTMSGGEQQMLAIGRGLMTDPKLMLLDEPSDGIMPTLVDQIASTLVAINQNDGISIVIVEQNVPMVFKMARRCIVLEKGRLVAEGERTSLRPARSCANIWRSEAPSPGRVVDAALRLHLRLGAGTRPHAGRHDAAGGRDVHGCSAQLDALLHQLQPVIDDALARRRPCELVMLGDYADRGPDSLGVLERLPGLAGRLGIPVHLLRGNHDQMLIDHLRPMPHPGTLELWCENGGTTVLAEADMAWDEVAFMDPAAVAEQLRRRLGPDSRRSCRSCRPTGAAAPTCSSMAACTRPGRSRITASTT